MARIGVIGSINTDLITITDRTPGPGETLFAKDFIVLPGGKGANQAVAAARLGAQVVLVGCLGDDSFGGERRAGLAAEGVDVAHVRTEAGVPSGIATILVDASGENHILVVSGANNAVTPGDVRAAEAALGACGVIVTQHEVPPETVAEVVAAGARLGVKVVLNPAPARPIDPALLAGVTYLVPNRGELALLSGLATERSDQVVAAARRLVRAGVGCVVVTLGADGAMIVTAERVAHIEAPLVTPVDTTGAGDAFIGCFATTLAEGGDADAAVVRAVRYAAMSVTRLGAQASYPTKAAFESGKS